MKKIVSLLVIATMIFSLTATFNIASVSAAAVDFLSWEYFDEATDNLYLNSEKTGVYFGYTGASSVKEISYGYVDGVSADENDSVLNMKTNSYTLQFNNAIDFSEKPVLNFSFKAYFPDDTAERRVYLSLSKKTAVAEGTNVPAIGDPEYWNTGYGNVYLTYNSHEDGAWCGVNANDGNAEVLSRNSYTTTPNIWHDCSIRVYTQRKGDIHFAMFIDNKLVGVVKSTNLDISVDDIGIKQINFQNDGADTYIKDIKLFYEDYDIAFNENSGSEYLSTIAFDQANPVSSNSTYRYPHYGTMSGTGTTYLEYSSGQSKAPFNDFSNVSTEIADENLGTDGVMKDVLKVTLNAPSALTAEGRFTLIQNSKSDISEYFSEGEAKTLQSTYDIKIPAGTEALTRQHLVTIGKNASTAIWNMSSKITNKKIEYAIGGSYTCYDADTMITSDYTIESDKWYTVSEIMYIKNIGSGKYDYTTEIFVYDHEANTTNRVVQFKGTLESTTGLFITNQRMMFTAASGTESGEISTYIDNLTLRVTDNYAPVKYLNVTLNNIDNNLSLTYNADGTVVANSKAIQENQNLIIAGYDSKGKMVALKVNTADDVNAETSDIVSSWEYGVHSGISRIKAFVFDSVENGMPLATPCDFYVE